MFICPRFEQERKRMIDINVVANFSTKYFKRTSKQIRMVGIPGISRAWMQNIQCLYPRDCRKKQVIQIDRHRNNDHFGAPVEEQGFNRVCLTKKPPKILGRSMHVLLNPNEPLKQRRRRNFHGEV